MSEIQTVALQIFAALAANRLDDFKTLSPEYCEEICWLDMSRLAFEGALELTKTSYWQEHSIKSDDEPT